MLKRCFSLVLSLCLILSLGSTALAEFPVDEIVTEPLAGGWTVTKDSTVTDHVKSLLDKAFDGLNSAIEPLALLGTQVVAGKNYCILCRITPAMPDPVPYYVLVYIYENLTGGAQLLQIRDFDIAALYAQEPDEPDEIPEAGSMPNG